jgi:endogenous inhibitor of DNA gyrase (YacG/DUF329 family)
MTSEQKERILDLRRNGFSYVEIGMVVGLHKNTVKTFCWRNRQPPDSATGFLSGNTTELTPDNAAENTPDDRPDNKPDHTHPVVEPIFQDRMCRQCGVTLIQPLKTKTRIFCGAKCGSAWRYRHRNDQAGKNTAIICARCGKSFFAYGSNHRKYCSHPCYMKDRFMESPHKFQEGSLIDKRAV